MNRGAILQVLTWEELPLEAFTIFAVPRFEQTIHFLPTCGTVKVFQLLQAGVQEVVFGATPAECQHTRLHANRVFVDPCPESPLGTARSNRVTRQKQHAPPSLAGTSRGETEER